MSNLEDSKYLELTIPQLVTALRNNAQVGSQTHSEINGALNAKLIERLSGSIDKHEQAESRLSRQIFWLNIILGMFTVVGTILAVISFFSQS